jgi:hypothetical protein
MKGEGGVQDGGRRQQGERHEIITIAIRLFLGEGGRGGVLLAALLESPSCLFFFGNLVLAIDRGGFPV